MTGGFGASGADPAFLGTAMPAPGRRAIFAICPKGKMPFAQVGI